MHAPASWAGLSHSVTPFIGRQSEVAELVSLLSEDSCRLFTLTGPGGSGKTRLAIEVTRNLSFHDGIYFVPLQPLRSADNIVTTIIDVLSLQLTGNVDPQQQLHDYLQEKHLLLVLDNFEHLLDGVEIVIDMLGATTNVKLLVTSRERLNLRTEQIWPVGGLEVPNSAADAPDTSSAVELFIARARRLQPGFSFDAQQDAVIRICQLVDGLPLALELAASWIRVMPCEAVADEIQRNIDILTTNQRDMPERHRSMRAVFDHSWHLLTADERAVFRKLSVFRGGFALDAADHIAGATLTMLAGLVDKSLVRMDDRGRYDLHELVRQYAEEKLDAAGEADMVLSAHCQYFARLMQEREAALKDQRQIEALDSIEADFENVRAAWHRAVRSRNHTLLNAAVEGLFLFCVLRSRFQDHLTLFEEALTSFDPLGNDESSATWGRIIARNYRFMTTNYAETPPKAIANSEIALQIARSRNDLQETAFCLYLLGKLTIPENEPQALLLLEESLQHFTSFGESFYRAYLLQDIGQCRDFLGQIEQAHAAKLESLELCRAYGLLSPMGRALSMLGVTEAFGNGHFTEGERNLREAVNLYKSLDSRGEVARYLRWLSAILFAQGDFAEARAQAEECRAIAHDLHNFEYLGASSAILGMTYNMEGDYRHGEVLGQESLRHGVTPTVLFFTGWSLACSYWGLHNFQAASDYLRFALQHADRTTHQPGFTAICTPIAALLYAQADHYDQSAALLAVAYTHPKSPTGWVERWPLLAQLRVDLENELGEEAYAVAWARGMTLDLEQVALKLKAGQKSEQVSPYVRINQNLLDPLSPRELEVLVLIAKGLTNREIADRLYVGVSTVKKHINHIYSKLGVEDRTQAVSHARALRLIA